MTLEIALVLGILAVALVLFVTEWVRMDLVALLVLFSLAVLGLVSPVDAVSGFANPAVVTVWAMFIISEGLTRAGIADRIGMQVAMWPAADAAGVRTCDAVAAAGVAALILCPGDDPMASGDFGKQTDFLRDCEEYHAP